ncbi:MAG TPA: FtsX-like permease family protein, partial [Gammaproteobacteria bacterium]
MIRSFVALRSVEPGIYDPARVQTLRIVFPRPQAPEFLSMQQQVVERIAAVPGVEAVAYSTRRPLLASGPSGPFSFDNAPEEPVETEFRFNSPGYFTALGAPLLAGRDFDWTDIRESRAVTLVSANIANARWGDPAAALGHTLSRGGPGATPLTIVGVVGDIRHDGVDRRAPETVYLTQSEFGARFATRSPFFFVRSGRVGTPGFVDEIRRAVWEVNSELPLGAVEPLSAVYERSMARTSLTLVLLAITSAMALLLGLVGIYAVIAYVLAQRTREIGIRMALGAQIGALKGMLLRQVLALVAVGVALGVGGAAALTRLMESLLFGVTALDAATYVSVSAALFAVAVLAGYLPARRVTRVDPMQSLRAE